MYHNNRDRRTISEWMYIRRYMSITRSIRKGRVGMINLLQIIYLIIIE